MRTKILLDVDGVCNIWPSANADKYKDTDMFDAQGYIITWSPSVMSRLYNLDAEINWLTTWQHDANTYIGPEFGWNELPVLSDISREEMHNAMSWWKLYFAIEQYDAGHDIIWIDDDIKYYPEALKWLDSTEHGRVLAISPDYGLTHDHLDQIEEWLDVPF